MQKLLATAALMLMVPVVASPQNADHAYRAEAYGFFAKTSMGLAGGGGAEVFVHKGLGVGGELDRTSMPLADRSDPSEIHLFPEIRVSANGYYGLPGTNKNRLEPFVTGGLPFLTTPPLAAGRVASTSGVGPTSGL